MMKELKDALITKNHFQIYKVEKHLVSGSGLTPFLTER